MPFDWMQPARLTERPGPDPRRPVFIDEITGRAGLLRRLGYPVGRAEARCVANYAWDFEIAGPGPLTLDEVRDAVRAVYGGAADDAPVDWPA